MKDLSNETILAELRVLLEALGPSSRAAPYLREVIRRMEAA